MQVLGTTNRDKRDRKLGQRKEFQIGAGISNRGKEISNLGRDYKSGQAFQIRAGITNRRVKIEHFYTKFEKLLGKVCVGVSAQERDYIYLFKKRLCYRVFLMKWEKSLRTEFL